MLRGLFVSFSSDSHVLNGSLGDEGWLAFVNTKGRHLNRGSCWELSVEAEMTTPATSREPHLSTQGLLPALPPLYSPSQGTQRLPTFKEYHLPAPWTGRLPQSISAEVCLFWAKLQPTLGSSLRAYYHLMLRFSPWALEWDLFWKLLTPLGGMNRHFNCSCHLFSHASLKPNTR